jgi:hypothetical protein
VRNEDGAAYLQTCQAFLMSGSGFSIEQLDQVYLLPIEMIRRSKPNDELLRDSHNLINGR